MRLPTPAEDDTGDEHWIESVAGPVRVRVFRHTSGGMQPCLIFMHGGGWTQGNPESDWDIAARIATWNRQTVISIDYALAPEEPFPAAIATLALDLRGSAVTLTGQLLIYPACDFDASRPCYRENTNGPMIRMDGSVEAMYCPNVEERKSPRYAPLLAETHAGLPPAYIAVAEHDSLRDSGRAYAEALGKAGVAVRLGKGKGLIHGYLRALDFCEASRLSLVSMAAWLDRINKGEVSSR